MLASLQAPATTGLAKRRQDMLCQARERAVAREELRAQVCGEVVSAEKKAAMQAGWHDPRLSCTICNAQPDSVCNESGLLFCCRRLSRSNKNATSGILRSLGSFKKISNCMLY